MCLFRQGKLQIADKDIVSYKVVNSNLKSQYYNFQYEIGKTYSKKWDKYFIDYCEEEDTIGGNAFHSSLDKNYAIWLYGENSHYDPIDGHQIPQLGTGQILLKCIIPAGTIYFKGNFSEIASEKIIIQEICH